MKKQIYMTFKGYDKDDIRWAKFDGNTWHGNKIIKTPSTGPPQTGASPALIFRDKKLRMFHRGEEHVEIYWEIFNGNRWTGNHQIKTANGGTLKTKKSPAVAAYKGKMYMVYRHHRHTTIHFTVYDDNSNNWQNDTKITTPNSGELRTKESPALVEFKGKLYMFYRNKRDSNIYRAIYQDDDRGWHDNQVVICPRTNVHPDLFCFTDRNPAIALFRDRLYIVYKDYGHRHLMWTTYNGKKCTIPQALKVGDVFPKTKEGPALVVFNNMLHLLHGGQKEGGRIRWSQCDGKSWHGNEQIKTGTSKPGTSTTPAVAVTAF